MEQQRPIQKSVTTQPAQYLQKGFQDIATQAGNLYSPTLTPQQQQAVTQAQSLGQTGATTAEQTARGDFLYGGPGFNQAYQAAANRILPQVNSQFARAGRSGSGLAQTAQTQALADAFAGLYGQERGLQQQAAMNLPSMAQSQIGLGGAPQDILFGNLGKYANILYPQAQYNQTQADTQDLYRNAGAGALGGALSGFKAFGSGLGALGGGLLGFLSDRRMKENIEKIGEKNGLNVYSFNYKNGKNKLIGYMADEVEKLYPNAVFTRPDGYKQVDYLMVGI